jgi:rsbT antagonist protein RsbS
MPGPEPPGTAEPRKVSILSQGPYLIVSIHTALDDSQITRLRRDLIDLVGSKRSRGIILDVSTLDVLDSFATRTLDQIAQIARLRGAETVVVGIAPEVAIAMVQLSLQMDFAHTALDLEEGLEHLEELTATAMDLNGPGGRSHGG